MIANITDQLRRDEDEKLSVYRDSLGYWTLGVGRLVDARKGGGITRAESAYLLANDVGTKSAALDERLPWWRTLSDARQGVLLNMAFQLGIDGLLAFTTTLGLVHTGQFGLAADAMLQSRWAQQTPERAKRLAEQMRSDQWQ